jgi:hypothetical protein
MKSLQDVIKQLKAHSQAICALVSGLTVEEARWKPDPETWSILEVLNHLVDEEIYDFRAHVKHILHTPDQPWPEIDPVGWVSQRQYNQQDLLDTLARYETEREKSLTWLAELSAPNWDAAVILPWGTLSAGDMLASWLAHDLLHVRQLVELRYLVARKASQPYRIEYAGKW